MARPIVCDGPDCGNERPPELDYSGWLTVEEALFAGDATYDFCSRACLARWAHEAQPARDARRARS